MKEIITKLAKEILKKVSNWQKPTSWEKEAIVKKNPPPRATLKRNIAPV